MRLQTVTDRAGLDAVYDDVLVPSFPPSELVSREWLHGSEGRGPTAVGAYEDEVLIGVAITEVVRPAVVLLSYLAALPSSRGSGVGSALLRHVRGLALDDGALLVLAEVERPDAHAGSPEHGDPTARVRFYARQGAQVLDLPYVQPPVSPDQPAVPGMLLLALDVDPSLLREAGSAVDGSLVAAAIDEMLGEEADDDGPRATLRAAARAPQIALYPAVDWARVRASV